MCTVEILQTFLFLFSFHSLPDIFKNQLFMSFSFSQFFCTEWKLHEGTQLVVNTTDPVSGIVPSSQKWVLNEYLSNEGKKEECCQHGVSLFLALTLPLVFPSFTCLQPFLTAHAGNLKLGDLLEVQGHICLQRFHYSSPLPSLLTFSSSSLQTIHSFLSNSPDHSRSPVLNLFKY